MIKKNIKQIVASSLDNYIIFYNDDTRQRASMIFDLSGFIGGSTIMTISDESNPDDFSLKIEGSPTAKNTATTFSTNGSKTNVILSLSECIRRNTSLFSNVKVNDTSITADIDTSRRYSVRFTNDIGIAVTVSPYQVIGYGKYTLQYTDKDDKTFIAQKYSNDGEVYFNATAPFELMAFKYPITYMIDGYSGKDGDMDFDFTNQKMTVLPTTLKKFDEFILDDFYYDENSLTFKRLLTNNTNRTYRDGEVLSFSFIGREMEFDLQALLYSPSGQFIGAYNLEPYIEYNEPRTDVYVSVDVDGFEQMEYKRIGSIKIRVVGTRQMYEDLTLSYKPICKDNHVLYFLNAFGGIDNFNFTDSMETESKLNDTVNIIATNLHNEAVREIESRKSHANTKTTTLTATVDKETAEWLREMADSKWVFYTDKEGRYITVIIDDMSIRTNDKDSLFTVSVKYHRSDNYLAV